MHLRIAFFALASFLTFEAVIAQQECHDYVVMSARGTSEPQGPSRGFAGMINTTLSNISNGIEYDVVYPASINLTAYLGTDDIVRYLNASLQSCPEQQYALLGYSQGAAAVALALARFNDTNDATYRAIKSVVVIGNPGHVANINGNVDQLGGNSTQNYTGAFYFDGALAIPRIYYNDNKVLDICYQGDPICAVGYPDSNFAQHVLYGSDPNVQKMGADFLISKLGESKATNGTAPASSSSSTSSGQTSATGSPSSSVPPSSPTGAASSFVSDVYLAIAAGMAVSILQMM